MNHWLSFFVVYQTVIPHWAELLAYLVKSSLVVGLTAALAFLLRNRSARSRNWAWRAALVSLAVLSFWKFGPQVATQYHPEWQVMPDLDALKSLAPAVDGHHHLDPMSALPTLFLFGVFVLADRAIMTAWVAGMAGYLLWRSSRAAIGAWWLRKSSRPAEDGVRRTAAEVSAIIEAEEPRVAICPELVTPLLSGVFAPVIFLPAACSDWKPEKLRAVLLHEMAHWQRGDLFWQGFATLVTALWWWNPLVWLAARKLRAEAEQAADDVVILSLHETPADYAQSLMEIAASASGQHISTGIAMVGRSSLEIRIRQLLANNPARGKINRLAMAFALALTCATIGLGGIYLGFGVGRGAADHDPVSMALDDAEKMTSEGKYEAALQKFLWYWEASKTSMGQVGYGFPLHSPTGSSSARNIPRRKPPWLPFAMRMRRISSAEMPISKNFRNTRASTNIFTSQTGPTPPTKRCEPKTRNRRTSIFTRWKTSSWPIISIKSAAPRYRTRRTRLKISGAADKPKFRSRKIPALRSKKPFS